MYENQNGFRKSHSTTHAINYSVDYIESCLKDKKHDLLRICVYLTYYDLLHCVYNL